MRQKAVASDKLLSCSDPDLLARRKRTMSCTAHGAVVKTEKMHARPGEGARAAAWRGRRAHTRHPGTHLVVPRPDSPIVVGLPAYHFSAPLHNNSERTLLELSSPQTKGPHTLGLPELRLEKSPEACLHRDPVRLV